jgi:hypothetical protein
MAGLGKLAMDGVVFARTARPTEKGEFVTMRVTRHFESHVGIIEKFLARKVDTEIKGELVRVRVAG